MAYYSEPARDVPVVASYDVVVAGGGVSGVAAAMGAARAGARTLIVERSGCFGGVATAGLMASISNRYFTASGQAVLGGPAREIVERLVAMGAASSAWMTPELPGITFDPEAMKVVLSRCLRDAGADTLTLAQISNVMLDGRALAGVIVDSIAGRQAIAGRVVVDATEGAVVAHMAGAPTFVENSNGSLLFRMCGVDVGAFVEYYAANPSDYPAQQDRAIPAEWFVRNWRERGVLFFPHGGGRRTALVQKHVTEGAYADRIGRAYDLDAFGLYAVRGSGPPAGGDLVAVNSNFFATDMDAWEATQREIEAREMALYAADFLRRNVPGFSNSAIAAMAEYVGVRASRWLDAAAPLEIADQTRPVRRPDVIGVTPCQGRSEGGGGMVLLSDWYDIPYGCMLPKGVPGLIVGSGKTVAVKPRGAMRGISRCLPIGHAAGVAAALAVQTGMTPETVDVRAVQRELLRQGAFLGTTEPTGP